MRQFARFVKLLWRAARRNDEQARFDAAEIATRWIYPTYRFSEFGRIFLDDKEFRRRYESLQADGTTHHHALDRHYVLFQLSRHAARLRGDTAECGVYQGAGSYQILEGTRGTDKQHHLFDSFAGLSPPEEPDGDFWRTGDMLAEQKEAVAQLEPFASRTVWHAGWIPSRFEEVSGARFALVHIDVDLHQPTKDSMEFFYPRMTPGGIMVLDDYGFRSCPGAKRAVDEYMADKVEPVIMLPTGQALIIKLGDSPG